MLKWIDVTDNENYILDLISYNTSNYKQYPVRFSFFERYPTLLSSENLTGLFIPGYMKQLFKYSDGHSGIDGIIMSYLIEYFNIKPILIKLPEANYGSYDKKAGNYVGTIGDVVYRKTDVAVNARFLKGYGDNTEDDIQFLSPTFFDKICVITPKALKIPKWKAPLLIFDPLAWVALFGIQIMSSLVWYFLRKWEAM